MAIFTKNDRSEWLILESAIPKKTPMEKACKLNRVYLEKIFHGK